MKRIFIVLTLLFGLLIFQSNHIKVQGEDPDIFEDWIIVTSGDEMNKLIKQAGKGQTLNIKAATDLTLGSVTTIPEDVTLTIDMDNHSLYTTGDSNYLLSSGNKVTLQNELIVSTGSKNSGITVPNPSGSGTKSGKYNSYYGLFYTKGSYQVMPILIFKNVTQDFRTITSWGAAGQPFYNYGIQVQFSGTNYFNYPETGQEFMEGAGFNVLDGKTQIFGGNDNGYSFVQQTWGGNLGKNPVGIDIAAGAELEINWQSSGKVNGMWALSGGGGAKATEFHINNQGTLNWNSAEHTPANFFSSSKLDIPFTYTFGPNSRTMINVPGLFNYNVTRGAFNSYVEKNADLIYNSGNNYPIFIGPNNNVAQFNINSAKRVRFITTRSQSLPTSILGNNVTLKLNIDEVMDEGYDVYAYNAFGGILLTPSITQGAFGVNGTLGGDLSDMNSLEGLHVPDESDIVVYQEAAQLEFVKQNKKILAFKTIPSDNEMMFKYELNNDLVDNILPRNDGELDMSFTIINTLTDSFSVQANITMSGFADGMTFAWKDDSSTIDLTDINNTIFTSLSSNMTNDGSGNYQINYLADEGLLFKSSNAKYNLGSYSAQINWTLINGI